MSNAVALQAIHRAIQGAESVIERAASDHLHAFTLQMREKVGVDAIRLQEPLLPLTIACHTVRYLVALDKIERRLLGTKSAEIEMGDGDDEEEEGDSVEVGFDEEDDGDEESGIDIEMELADAQNDAELGAKQGLDGQRQPAFGIDSYMWVGGDCPECAPNDGEIFNWGEGDEPGSIHPNCRCSAEPVLGDPGDGGGDPPPGGLTPEQQAALMNALLAALAAALPPHGKAGVAAARTAYSAADKLVNGSLAAGRAIGRRLKDFLDDASDALNPEGESIGQTPEDILNPNGQSYGRPGNGNRIRVQDGGDKAARNLFNRLSKGGIPETPSGYPGKGTRLQNGDWIGYRPTSRSGSPTIDVNANGVPFRKIHFSE